MSLAVLPVGRASRKEDVEDLLDRIGKVAQRGRAVSCYESIGNDAETLRPKAHLSPPGLASTLQFERELAHTAIFTHRVAIGHASPCLFCSSPSVVGRGGRQGHIGMEAD